MSTSDPSMSAKAAQAADVRKARLHHLNFLTTRLDEMIQWYGTVFDMKVNFLAPGILAFLTNDEANHRIALTAVPSLVRDHEKRVHDRLHHSAFEYTSFDDLNATYLRLRDQGIVPRVCIDHVMTFSYYYTDPDDNFVELQCDNFGDWAKSTESMRTPQFAANPIGAFLDAGKVAAAYANGMTHEQIRQRLWTTNDFRPESFDMGLPPRRPGDPPLPGKW